jgi:hypothetical protein
MIFSHTLSKEDRALAKVLAETLAGVQEMAETLELALEFALFEEDQAAAEVLEENLNLALNLAKNLELAMSLKGQELTLLLEESQNLSSRLAQLTGQLHHLQDRPALLASGAQPPLIRLPGKEEKIKLASGGVMLIGVVLVIASFFFKSFPLSLAGVVIWSVSAVVWNFAVGDKMMAFTWLIVPPLIIGMLWYDPSLFIVAGIVVFLGGCFGWCVWAIVRGLFFWSSRGR